MVLEAELTTLDDVVSMRVFYEEITMEKSTRLSILVVCDCILTISLSNTPKLVLMK